jgi:hypothetical protein
VVSTDTEDGQTVLQDRNLDDYEELLQTVLEIARRYKITNPEKMRSEYGKLVLLMQDAMSAEILPLLSCNIHREIKTVYSLLEEGNALEVLEDRLIHLATMEIPDDKSKSRGEIQNMIRKKEKARKEIAQNMKYHTGGLTRDDIEQCLFSISDNESFLNSNRVPVDDAIHLLKTFFHPRKVETGYSLAIDEGTDGARLTHSHNLQYDYVLQSLTLWRNIIDDIYRLW